jgi:leucyl-tRNA synthetase
MDYNFREIEKKWQAVWLQDKTYKVEVDESRPKFYVLDMFPYPSGAGLHVGHPLGYIASDIYSRYKRLSGFNVLHPMGYDAFGLPAEQYAIQTGQHPALTTDKNIARYREQLDKIGFSYDWDREVKTCDPSYYKWTQWAFIRMFNHWYNKKTDKAEPIETLISAFVKSGDSAIEASCNEHDSFTAAGWQSMNEKEKADMLMNYRIAYQANATVNWCPALGTVLANDEVKDGVSLRGGHAVEQRKMKQWLLRVIAYAHRLLAGLDKLEWSDSLKEMQRNWIGRSDGAEIAFKIKGSKEQFLIFTTRPDTLWGVTFMVLAPESEWVEKLTTSEHKAEVDAYLKEVKKRNERERIADTTKTGRFTGAYAIHPFSGKEIPIWVSDYVLAGYGTGAIMAVPAHDQRDWDFARAFNLPIIPVIEGGNIEKEAFDSWDAKVINSDFITGMQIPDAIKLMNEEIGKRGIGTAKKNYRIRDAIFSRQRYWGEPFPVYYKNGIATVLNEKNLPLTLPEVESYQPTEKGEPPLGRAKNWHTSEGYPFEMSTMPGFAGSSAYYLRYMDPLNTNELVSKKANNYWQDVDLYIGGTEHATGHLIYSRFWNKFLFDTGYVCKDEPFKKLINQGMIQGRSSFVYRVKNTHSFVSLNLKNDYEVTPIHVDVNIVDNDQLDLDAFRKWNPEYENAEFILEDGKYICGWSVEKMSKSLFNVVNPDIIIERYGADTLRLYEMFLGPLEQSKPWDINGIDGVSKFFKKFWRLFHDPQNSFSVSDGEPDQAELKVLHKTIKKIHEDIERFSFNTSVSNFMICVNELTDLKSNKRKVLEPLVILISPFAPHIAEELWQLLGYKDTIFNSTYPKHDAAFLTEDNFTYPVSFNGKMRFKLELPLNISIQEIEKAALADPNSKKWLNDAAPKKLIIVPGKIINIVV